MNDMTEPDAEWYPLPVYNSKSSPILSVSHEGPVRRAGIDALWERFQCSSLTRWEGCQCLCAGTKHQQSSCSKEEAHVILDELDEDGGNRPTLSEALCLVHPEFITRRRFRPKGGNKTSKTKKLKTSEEKERRRKHEATENRLKVKLFQKAWYVYK